MAFEKKTWQDRVSEHPARRKLTNVATSEEVTYDVARAEGTVSQIGDVFNATTMNDLEDRIAEGISTFGDIICGTLTTGATSITFSNEDITTNTIFSFYTSIYGVNPETVTVSTGSVVLTFEAQASDMIVGYQIEGVYTQPSA